MVQEESAQVRTMTLIRQGLYPYSHEPSKYRVEAFVPLFVPTSILRGYISLT